MKTKFLILLSCALILLEARVQAERPKWYEFVAAVVCTVGGTAAVPSLGPGLIGLQTVYLGQSAKQDSLIAASFYKPTWLEGTIQNVDPKYVNIFRGMVFQPLPHSGDTNLVAFENAVNNLRAFVNQIPPHWPPVPLPIPWPPDTIPPLLLTKMANIEVAYNNLPPSYHLSITQNNINDFKAACATGHLPPGEDLAFAQAGLNSAQRDSVAVYFASLTINLNQSSASIGTVIHEMRVPYANPNRIPTLGEWGLIILGIILLGSGAMYILRKKQSIIGV